MKKPRNYLKITEFSEEMTGDKTKIRPNSLSRKNKKRVNLINQAIQKIINIFKDEDSNQ